MSCVGPIRSVALAIVAAALLVAPCQAQDYPAKAVRVLVPYPAGGQSDIFMRLVADSLKEQLGKPFVVENRPGAATTLAAELVAKSPPDGHTILLAAASATAIAPATIKNLSFKPKEITPITLIAKVPYVLVASKSFAPNTMAAIAYQIDTCAATFTCCELWPNAHQTVRYISEST